MTLATDLTEPSAWFEKLRKKWGTIPSGNDLRQDSAHLLTLGDAELLHQWERARAHDTQGTGFGIRGWYHDLYSSFMSGKKVLDIGCGMGISTITFAEMGAALTFVDIISDNIRLVERLCAIKGIQAQFLYMSGLQDIDALDTDYDVVTAIGSLINAPLDFTKLEVRSIKKHLRPGGRWLHFAYPKSRWVREGSIDFAKWGEMTDGPGTPWMEYHDRDKINWLFEDSEIQVLFECEFHNSDFNWFDIQMMSM